MEIARLLAIVRTRWLIVLLCVAAVLVLTVVLNTVLPPKYTAAAAIVVDVRGVNPVLGTAEVNTVLPRNVLGTQASMVRSEGVARQVVGQLGLVRDPVLLEAWQDETEGRGDAAAWIAQRLLKSLDVRPDAEDSNVLDLQFSARDPVRAAAVVNAFANAYLSTALGLRSQSSRVNADFFTEQTQTLRAQVEQAQTRLSAYQREHGIVGEDERLDVETASLGELSAQLNAAQALRIEAQSRNDQAAGRASTSPDVLGSPVVQQLMSAVAAASAKLKVAKGGRLGSNFAQVAELEDELTQLRAELATEVERAEASLKVNSKITSQREAAIKEKLEAQRKRVLSLKTLRDGMAVLERDVDSTRKAYEQAQQRQIQTRQEGNSPTAEATILTVGVPPAEPSRPGLKLLLPLGLVLGGLLGIGAAVLLEIRRPLIHFASDLAAWGVPVMAVLPHASMPRQRALSAPRALT